MTIPADRLEGAIGTPYEGSFNKRSLVLQKSGSRGNLPPVIYGGEQIAAGVTLREGDHVVFAKLNIINEGETTGPKVSVTCELRVGTQVDKYEMLEIPGKSMRLASLIVGANLTALTRAQIFVKSYPADAKLQFSNVVIASIQVHELTVLEIT
jgi:hypothetical protein